MTSVSYELKQHNDLARQQRGFRCWVFGLWFGAMARAETITHLQEPPLHFRKPTHAG